MQHSHITPILFYIRYGSHRELHSFPTRRSSDLERRIALKQRSECRRVVECIEDVETRQLRGRDQIGEMDVVVRGAEDRKSTRLNSSHVEISYAVFCLKKKMSSTLLTSSTGRLD